jgi:hypothetical protein
VTYIFPFRKFGELKTGNDRANNQSDVLALNVRKFVILAGVIWILSSWEWQMSGKLFSKIENDLAIKYLKAIKGQNTESPTMKLYRFTSFSLFIASAVTFGVWYSG